jgi:hypothetical protein
MKFLERHARTILGGNNSPLARSVVPVDISPIAEWYFKDAEIFDTSLRKDFPTVVAPHPVTYFEYKIPATWKIRTDDGKWIEHRTPHGPSDYFGILFVQDVLPDNYTGRDPEEGAIINSVLAGIPEKATPKFLQRTFFFAGNGNDITPACWVNNYVDENGRMLGGPVGGVHHTLQSRSANQPEGEAFGDIVRCYGYPIYFALSLLGCKNVKLQPRIVTDRDRQIAAKNKSVAFVYRDITVESLRKSISSGEHGTGNSVVTAMRIADGHWKDYTQGNGLFGKLHGRFWWDDYVRVVKGTEKAIDDLRTFNYRINKPSEKRIHPEWVCADCATAAGGKSRRTPTWHNGKCGVCSQTKPVTQPRDYGNPPFFAHE